MYPSTSAETATKTQPLIFLPAQQKQRVGVGSKRGRKRTSTHLSSAPHLRALVAMPRSNIFPGTPVDFLTVSESLGLYVAAARAGWDRIDRMPEVRSTGRSYAPPVPCLAGRRIPVLGRKGGQSLVLVRQRGSLLAPGEGS